MESNYKTSITTQRVKSKGIFLKILKLRKYLLSNLKNLDAT